ncbi:SDR family oxidoreductase [Olivibacter sp. 47]|uniref:SDR family oxidoreductase n=1 Tax=Olivibacter sp. 47 TaxID=3056486 RepID=UPI0025A4C043|nr:SDR family oxidoreductase [Olivibacter sp. 47]MDM8175468.1 SDR family oxidoreductase [Olivibacter sp. 47]
MWRDYLMLETTREERDMKRRYRKNFSDKVIVITGASSGSGKAMAEQFALAGATLVLAARNIEALEELASDCRSLGAEVLVQQTDVSKPLEVIHLADMAASFKKRIDIWINNAGVLAVGNFEDMPIEVHDQLIQTNLMGYLHGAYTVIPYFKKQGRGTLINNISVGGFLPVPYGVSYSASKFGIRGFSDALKAELRKWPHIHICDVYPAFLDTPGMSHAANYTGKVIQPMPPVHDPVRFAKSILKLADNPASFNWVHLSAAALSLAYRLFPKLTSYFSYRIISSYLKRADLSVKTDGNVFLPLAYNVGIIGGWRYATKEKIRPTLAKGALGILGLTALLLVAPLLSRKVKGIARKRQLSE